MDSILPRQSELFLPLDSVRLGRFVMDVERPDESFHDPLDTHISPRKESSFSLVTQHEAGVGSRLGLSLTALVSARLSRQTRSNVRVSPTICKYYRMANVDDYFDAAVRAPETRKWVERAANRRSGVYLITGYQTLTDAQITQTQARDGRVGGSVTIPVSVLVPTAGIADPEVEAQHGSNLVGVARYDVAGEAVVALEYRKIVFKWLPRSELDLSKPRRWQSKIMTRAMVSEDEEDEEESEDEESDEEGEGYIKDVIEVSLEDVVAQ